MSYQPPEKILEKYARVLINFALNHGQGVRENEVVLLQVPESAKPMLQPLRRQVLLAGAYPIIQYLPENISREFYLLANRKQLTFFPKKYLGGLVKEINHCVSILSETDKHELEGIDPQKILRRNRAFAPYKQWREDKEKQGKFSWTLALYGTEAAAHEANLTLKQYWQQIIKACFLDYRNPIKKWQEVLAQINKIKKKLNALKIEKVHILGKDIDLTLGIGADRQWIGGSGANIPSFEIFTAPNFRIAQGHAYFNQPLYAFGQLIKGISLEFKNGRIIRAKAQRGEATLKEIIKTPGANHVGEFSLTEGRMSRVTHFMAETLYDENRGGRYGNFHIALGSSYKECYAGTDGKKLEKQQWKQLGFNDSPIHIDIVSTDDRQVTAHLKNGEKRVIYQDGRFTL